MYKPLIYITRRQAFFFAGFLVLYQTLTYIANDMIMPGMIAVVKSFNAPESNIASSLTFFILGGASLQIFLGPLSDRFGRRPLMLIGAALFFIFTLLISGSQTMEQFLLARYFQGMGLCFIGVVGYSTLQEIFAEMEAIRLIALLANVASMAPLLGPLAGASFILYFNWRFIFIAIGVLAAFALWGLWRYMPESVGVKQRNGIVIHAASLTPAAILRNYKRLLLNPLFMIGAFSIGMIGIPSVAWIALSPIMIVTDAHLSVMHYALWQLPIFGATILGNWCLALLTHRYDIKTIILIGSALSTFGLIFSFILPACYSFLTFYILIPGLAIYSFGLGIVIAPLNRFILFSSPISKGTVYALISMISMLTQALGVEGGNRVYVSHNLANFGFYCALIALIYLVGLNFVFKLAPNYVEKVEMPSSEQPPTILHDVK